MMKTPIVLAATFLVLFPVGTATVRAQVLVPKASLTLEETVAPAALNTAPVLKKLQRVVAEDAPYGDPDLLDQEQIQLRVARSNGIQTGFDFANEGRPEPVDVIRYLPARPSREDLIAGPTLVFRRGRTNQVKLSNELRVEEQPVLSYKEGCDPGTPPDVWKQDAAEDLFGTNLHTHGLHVEPTGMHDNVFLNVGPQTSANLEFTLRPDHRAGTFWYHAHRHGSVAYQLTNGMAGALVVPGQPKADPTKPDAESDDLEAIPEVEQANHIPYVKGNFGRVMLIQQFRFAETGRRARNGKPVWIVDPADVSDRRQATPADNAGRITADLLPDNADNQDGGPPTRYTDVLATNGVRVPIIRMRRGCVERWRFIHAGIESSIDARWYRWDGTQLTAMTDEALRMYEVALDGIPTGYRDEVPTLTLRPGSRNDLLVQVSPDAIPGDKYMLFTDEANVFNPERFKRGRRTRASGDPLPAEKVPPNAIAIVEIGRETHVMNLPKAEAFARWQIKTPLEPQRTRTVGFHFIDADDAAPPVEPHGAGGEFGVTENYAQKPYAQTAGVESIGLRIGRAEEWTLMVDNGEHPFHIHVNPFQVQDPRYVDDAGNARWVWRDTLLLDAGNGPRKIRLRPEDFPGRSVLHCHILDHEDQGMMKDITIVDVDGRESLATAFLQPVPEQAGHALPPRIFPGEGGQRQVVVVFTGVQCPHCAATLRELARASSRFPNAKVTAISTLPVPEDARKRLGIPEGANFQIYPEVPDQGFFERLGVVAPEGWVEHAVLVFDAKGNEAFRYVGERPLPDVGEISHALARLAVSR